MAPHRRSSRLLTTTTRRMNKTNNFQLSRIEADDSSPNQSQSFNPVLNGPNPKDNETPLLTKYSTHISTTPIPQTPVTTGRIRPAPEEMHPSKSHLSTTHGPDSGLRLGFTDITTASSNQPSGITQKTPTKKGVSECSFDFKFSRPNTQLGPEAQRMMEELQLEAQKIKAKMASERDDKKQKEESSKVMDHGRKVAHPKSKIGRFSDAHMLEFKKMNSIADHPSVLRTQASNLSTTKNLLKRSPSKAELDDNNTVRKKLSRNDKKLDSVPKQQSSISAKRIGKKETTSAFSRKLASTPSQSNSFKAPPFMSAIPEVVIPSGGAQTSATPNLTGSMSPSKLNNNKISEKLGLVTMTNTPSSIPVSPRKACASNKIEHIRPNSCLLDRSQKPEHAVSIFSRSPNKDKEHESRYLHSNISTRLVNGRDNSNIANKFGFTPKTIRNNTAIDQSSPSPVKPGITQSKPLLKKSSRSSLNKKSAAKANRILFPSISKAQELGKSSAIEYPSLSEFHSPPKPSNQLTKERQLPSAPGTFTFRSDQSIKFCPSQNNFGISSGKLSIRQVSASDQTNDAPCNRPKSNKEKSQPPILKIPTKKRARTELEDELPASRTAKKTKLKATGGPSFMTHKLRKGKETLSSIPTPSKPRGVLTISRLNMLSRPKIRN
ncbi:erythromycin esterase [Blumeria hordei DH14]|uniref:Erythromycin esterase n=1 Tax=Blumeria graminis f. sp. hordei (strain DH14) TaxID=546991 RepID=N1JKF3_BLUG1|nr:erythromycin esterase [Blumeria hordei DH14]